LGGGIERNRVHLTDGDVVPGTRRIAFHCGKFDRCDLEMKSPLIQISELHRGAEFPPREDPAQRAQKHSLQRTGRGFLGGVKRRTRTKGNSCWKSSSRKRERRSAQTFFFSAMLWTLKSMPEVRMICAMVQQDPVVN
jgi:hypothetical protein